MIHQTMSRAGLAAAACVLGLWSTQASAAPDCAALSKPIYHRINPTSQANLLTPWKTEADKAGTTYGFTDDRGTPFKASWTAGSGLVPAHRLHKPGSSDFVWITNQAEIANAVSKYGYVDNGPNFYVSPVAASCAQPVYRLLKGSKHRHVAGASERDALVAAGWISEGIAFYAAVASNEPVDTKFSIAVMPDTQGEVQASEDRVNRDLSDFRFRNRSQWLASNKTNLDIRFVTHSGDVTNWGERDEHQYKIASEGLKPLDDAGIPYSLSIGNHDTRAVGCPGGGACPGNVAAMARETPLFNQYFNNRFKNIAGRFEAGKVDNHYSLFEAGGAKWMVLVLELWPRQAAIDWAKGVVAAHAQHNVIVVTHSYLNGDGSIYGSNGGYGSTSPQHLFNTLIRVYPNIRMVFSGHVGNAASRVDTGLNGNKIVSFLETLHAPKPGNPVRIVEIDTATNNLSTLIYSPANNVDYPQYSRSESGMNYVK